MSEATAQATPLSIASAVDSLLAAEAPVEETPTQPEVVAETDDEVEVEAVEETEDDEDILQADEAEEDETEEAEEAEEVVEAEEEPVQTYRVRVGDDEVDLTLDELQSGSSGPTVVAVVSVSHNESPNDNFSKLIIATVCRANMSMRYAPVTASENPSLACASAFTRRLRLARTRSNQIEIITIGS